MSPEELNSYSVTCMAIGALAVLSIELLWMIVRRVIARRRKEDRRRAGRTILHRI